MKKIKINVKENAYPVNIITSEDVYATVPDSAHYMVYTPSTGLTIRNLEGEISLEKDFLKMFPEDAILDISKYEPEELKKLPLTKVLKYALELNSFQIDKIPLFIYGFEAMLQRGIVNGPVQMFLDQLAILEKENYGALQVYIPVTPAFTNHAIHDQIMKTSNAAKIVPDYEDLIKEHLGTDHTFGLSYSQVKKYDPNTDVNTILENENSDLTFIHDPHDGNKVVYPENVWEFIEQEKKIRKKGVKKLYTNGLILTGTPGTGKSVMAESFAAHFNIPGIKFSISKIMDSLIGKSAKNMQIFLDKVRRIGECVLFIDEMDKIFDEPRGGGSKSHREVLGLFLTFLSENRDALVVCTMNDPTVFPKELTRPGRFDTIIEVNNPVKASEIYQLADLFASRYLEEDIYLQFADQDIDSIVNIFRNVSPASMETVFKLYGRSVLLEDDPEFNTFKLNSVRKSVDKQQSVTRVI